MDRSIHKNTRTSGCLPKLREQVEQQRITEERQDKKDSVRVVGELIRTEGWLRNKRKGCGKF